MMMWLIKNQQKCCTHFLWLHLRVTAIAMSHCIVICCIHFVGIETKLVNGNKYYSKLFRALLCLAVFLYWVQRVYTFIQHTHTHKNVK